MLERVSTVTLKQGNIRNLVIHTVVNDEQHALLGHIHYIFRIIVRPLFRAFYSSTYIPQLI